MSRQDRLKTMNLGSSSRMRRTSAWVSMGLTEVCGPTRRTGKAMRVGSGASARK